jgi:hypothetical protein
MQQEVDPASDDEPLSLAEAERRGYTVTLKDCRRRLKVRTDRVVALLRTGELPSVRVPAPGRPAYRVRPADLEATIARLRPGVDAREMARIVSETVGFEVSPRAVVHAAADGKIPVRRANNRLVL